MARMTLRFFAPGHNFLDIDQWLITTEQPTRVPPGFRRAFPESMAALAYADYESNSNNTGHHHRLSQEIAAAMSVALERCIDIPYEIATRVEGSNEITFLPIGGTVDRVITGPLPSDSVQRIKEIFQQIGGLLADDVLTIGAAISLFHGATLLHDHDIRSAYTLLVAGIEVLSRQYGQPPTDWDAWEDCEQWDSFFVEKGFSDCQSDALRHRLMADRQLRLSATFRAYGSSRLPASFWDQPWVEWIYQFNIPPADWGAPSVIHEGRIRDFLPSDRVALRRMLGISYNLRSSYVHNGAWIGHLELILNPAVPLDVSRPLPFPILRAILRELICVELSSRSRGDTLPDVWLRRNWVPSAT